MKRDELGRLRNADRAMTRRKNRILVVSFLYPDSYYKKDVLDARLKGVLSAEEAGFRGVDLDFLVFGPGFLRGEDLVESISSALDCSALEGRPFSGVLLDGLHNVFLQFPALLKNDMVWPSLYNVLSRYNVTVVTTFTTFTLDVDPTAAQGDRDLILKGHLPILHVLVQATDFYLLMEKRKDRHTDEYGENTLEVKSCIKQPIPRDKLIWNRENLTLMHPRSIVPS